MINGQGDKEEPYHFHPIHRQKRWQKRGETTTNRQRVNIMLKFILPLLAAVTTYAQTKPDAFCEPSKARAFPEMATLRKVEVNKDTGEVKYFDRNAPGKDDLMLEPLITLTNTTFSEFSWYVRHGYPVIVTDMAKDWPMLGWECEDFAREFPKGEMKGEYGGGRVILGERHWMEKVRDAGQHIERCDTPQCNDRESKPYAAPHVWHVKDEEPFKTRRRIQEMFRVPYFMEEDPVGNALNKPDVNESLEFWLSPPGAGAFAHADAYCTMTASVQLNGHKRWRMMNPGPQVDSVFDRYDTQDSGIYRVSKWTPEYEFIVPNGGGVVFPPYNIHETIADTRQCTTATTFNFFSPQPTRYIRNFLPRLMNTHLGYSEMCGNRWDRYATFIDPNGYPYKRKGETLQRPFAASINKEDIQEHHDWIMNSIDTDSNNELNLEEIVNYFKSHPNGAWGRDIRHHTGYAFGRFKKYAKLNGAKINNALIVSIANDTMVYHDLDDNEIITSRELMDSLVQWHSVNYRLHRLQKGLKAGATKALKNINERGKKKVKKKELQKKIEVFKNDMKILEEQIIKDTAKLNTYNQGNDESKCIGELHVQDPRPAFSDFADNVPYWSLSLQEDKVLRILGEEGEETRDFGQEDPEDYMDEDDMDGEEDDEDDEGEEDDEEDEESRRDEL